MRLGGPRREQHSSCANRLLGTNAPHGMQVLQDIAATLQSAYRCLCAPFRARAKCAELNGKPCRQLKKPGCHDDSHRWMGSRAPSTSAVAGLPSTRAAHLCERTSSTTTETWAAKTPLPQSEATLQESYRDPRPRHKRPFAGLAPTRI